MWYVSSMTHSERIDNFMAGLGMEVYRVGGSVRDELLGRKIKDCDYMIRGERLDTIRQRLNARGYDIERFAVSPLVLRDGRQAGWRVSGRGLGLVEIVLPRTERPRPALPGENTHRAFEIVLDPDLPLEEDAKRRDFTFNALYKPVREDEVLSWPGAPDKTILYNRKDGSVVIDPTGRGLDDLYHRKVNVTHADSFRDDPLRTLRALRFVSTLDYELGAETYFLMREHAEAVTGLTAGGVSGTVLDEFSKLLMGQCPAKALRIARDTGVLSVALPELAAMLGFEQGSRYHDMTTDEHTFTALETAAHVGAPLRVRLALLFHDAGKPATAWVGKDGRKHYYRDKDHTSEDRIDPFDGHVQMDHEEYGAILWDEAAQRLGADRRLRDDVRTLIENHMVPCAKVDPVRVRRERVRLGDDLLRDLYMMRSCDLSGKGEKNTKFLLNVGGLEAARAAAEGASVPTSPKDLEINGHDLIAEGITGRAVGDVLRAVLDEVVCDPSDLKRTREWQMDRALAHAGKP